MGMGSEGVEAIPGLAIPNLDRLVLRGGIDSVDASPSYTCYRLLVTGQNRFDTAKGYVPDSNGAIF